MPIQETHTITMHLIPKERCNKFLPIQTTRSNNYHMTEHTHVPRRPSLDLTSFNISPCLLSLSNWPHLCWMFLFRLFTFNNSFNSSYEKQSSHTSWLVLKVFISNNSWTFEAEGKHASRLSWEKYADGRKTRRVKPACFPYSFHKLKLGFQLILFVTTNFF